MSFSVIKDLRVIISCADKINFIFSDKEKLESWWQYLNPYILYIITLLTRVKSKERKIYDSENKYKAKGLILADDMSLVFCNDDSTVRTYYGTKKIFNNFLKKHKLDNLDIHFHTLHHTYSNMLFEADQNPKVIQALLGHKSVKTTISTYNSVDKSYFQKATDVLNNAFKTQEAKQAQEMEDNELDEELERLLREKQERRRRKQQDFEM